MSDHVRILGILHIVFGCLGVLGALIVLGIFVFSGTMVGIAAEQDPDAVAALPVLGAVGMFLFIVILIVSVPGIIAGVGLLQFRPWGRILGIVISALELLNVPIGTALGVYGLWVLLNQETERLFAQLPPASPRRAA